MLRSRMISQKGGFGERSVLRGKRLIPLITLIAVKSAKSSMRARRPLYSPQKAKSNPSFTCPKKPSCGVLSQQLAFLDMD